MIMKTISKGNRILVFLAAALMISAYFTPLWQISLWAPQYPEGLNMKIWIDQLSGDVNIINGVNHYIGMKHIGEEMFPEFSYLIYVFGFIIAVGFIAALTGKKIPSSWLFSIDYFFRNWGHNRHAPVGI